MSQQIVCHDTSPDSAACTDADGQHRFVDRPAARAHEPMPAAVVTVVSDPSSGLPRQAAAFVVGTEREPAHGVGAEHAGLVDADW